MTPDEVVAYYSRRYRYGYLADWELARDLRELESLRDDAWYRAGWYEVLGYDRHGIAYVQTADEYGDSRWSYGSGIERDNEYSVFKREQR